MSSPSAVYRALLRQANKASIHAPAKRNAGLQTHLRQMVAALPPTSAPTYQTAADELLEVANFMQAQRVHSELLERYNPTHGMTVQERTHMTARRVGLDLPVEAKPMEG